MAREISEGRKAAYYAGTLLIVVGLLLFLSTFFTFVSRFGDFEDFGARTKSEMLRALGGMGLMLVGGIVRSIGARGTAGSGVVLDPQQAREDFEPYSRMVGGMVKDALEEARPAASGPGSTGPARVVVIKCRACGKLNEEDSKFCQECGRPV